jgi:hypothetical protein
MTQKLEGVFQITGWDESPYQENDDGSKWSHAKIKQTYSGSIEGSSDVQYLMSYQSPASAVFVGHEIITANIVGKSGSFVLQHNGTFENGVAKSSFQVVSGSAKGDYVDLEGGGSFESTENGQANYTFSLNA